MKNTSSNKIEEEAETPISLEYIKMVQQRVKQDESKSKPQYFNHIL